MRSHYVAGVIVTIVVVSRMVAVIVPRMIVPRMIVSSMIMVVSVVVMWIRVVTLGGVVHTSSEDGQSQCAKKKRKDLSKLGHVSPRRGGNRYGSCYAV